MLLGASCRPGTWPLAAAYAHLEVSPCRCRMRSEGPTAVISVTWEVTKNPPVKRCASVARWGELLRNGVVRNVKHVHQGAMPMLSACTHVLPVAVVALAPILPSVDAGCFLVLLMLCTNLCLTAMFQPWLSSFATYMDLLANFCFLIILFQGAFCVENAKGPSGMLVCSVALWNPPVFSGPISVYFGRDTLRSKAQQTLWLLPNSSQNITNRPAAALRGSSNWNSSSVAAACGHRRPVVSGASLCDAESKRGSFGGDCLAQHLDVSGVWVKLWRPTCKRLKPWWWLCPNSVFQMPCSLKPLIWRWWICMIWPPMALENPKFEMPWGAWEARKPWGSRSGSNQLTFWKSSKNSLGSPRRDVNQLQVFRGPLAPAPVWFWPTMMIWRHWQQHMSCEFGCFLTCCRNEFVDLLWLLQMNQSTSRVRCRITNSWSLCAPKTAWKLCPWFVGSQNGTTLHHFVISFQSCGHWFSQAGAKSQCLKSLVWIVWRFWQCLLFGRNPSAVQIASRFSASPGELNLKRLDSSQSCQIWTSDPYCRDNIRLWRDHHPSWKPDYEFIHLISPYENMSNMFNMFIYSFLHLERSKTLCFLFSFAVLAPTLIRPASAALLSSRDFGGEYSHRSTSTAVEQWKQRKLRFWKTSMCWWNAPSDPVRENPTSIQSCARMVYMFTYIYNISIIFTPKW